MYIKSQMKAEDGTLVTVLDTDTDEFMFICNSLRSNKMCTENDARSMVNNRVIPCIARGTDTNNIFNRYKIDTDYITVLLDDVQMLEEIFRDQGGKIESLL